MSNEDPFIEYPQLCYNLALSRVEYLRRGVLWTAIPIGPNQISPLEDNHVLLGDDDDMGIPVEISGDGTLINTGALTITNVHYPVVHLIDSVDLDAEPGFYWIDTDGQDDIHVGLPSAVGLAGQVFTINAMQSDFMDVHATVGGQTIDGSTTPLDIHNNTREFISDGANWHTI